MEALLHVLILQFGYFRDVGGDRDRAVGMGFYSENMCSQEYEHKPCSCIVEQGDMGSCKTFPVAPYYDAMHEFDKASVYEVDTEYVCSKIKAAKIKEGMPQEEASRQCYIIAGEWYALTKKQFNTSNGDEGIKKKASNRAKREKNGDKTNMKKNGKK